MSPRRITGWLLVFIGVAILALKLSHTYDPAPTVTKWSVKAGPSVAHFVKTSSPDMVVYIVLVGLPLAIGALLLSGATKSEPPPSSSSSSATSEIVSRALESREIPALNR